MTTEERKAWDRVRRMQNTPRPSYGSGDAEREAQAKQELEEAVREVMEASHNRSSMEWQDWALEVMRYTYADVMRGVEWETARYAEAQVYATLSVAAAIRER